MASVPDVVVHAEGNETTAVIHMDGAALASSQVQGLLILEHHCAHAEAGVVLLLEKGIRGTRLVTINQSTRPAASHVALVPAHIGAAATATPGGVRLKRAIHALKLPMEPTER